MFRKTSVGEISLSHKIGYNDAEMTYALETAFVQFYYGSKPISRAVKNKFIRFFNTSRFGIECGTVSCLIIIIINLYESIKNFFFGVVNLRENKSKMLILKESSDIFRGPIDRLQPTTKTTNALSKTCASEN